MDPNLALRGQIVIHLRQLIRKGIQPFFLRFWLVGSGPTAYWSLTKTMVAKAVLLILLLIHYDLSERLWTRGKAGADTTIIQIATCCDTLFFFAWPVEQPLRLLNWRNVRIRDWRVPTREVDCHLLLSRITLTAHAWVVTSFNFSNSRTRHLLRTRQFVNHYITEGSLN